MTTKKIGLYLGPILFFLTLFLFDPDGLNDASRAVLATSLWIAIWWITEALPIAVTALLPIVLFPLSGGMDLASTSAAFGHKFIFLIMGGFIIAIAIEKWNLHKRIALNIIYFIGTDVKKNHFRFYGGYCFSVHVDFQYSYFSDDASHRDCHHQAIER